MNINKKIFKRSIVLSLCLVIITFSIIFIYKNNFSKLKADVFNLEETNGAVTLAINNITSTNLDDSNYINWHYSDTNTVRISVDFKDTISDNKKIVINLNEGMMYRSYPVLEVSDSMLETKIEESDNLYTAIKSVDTPNIITNSNVSYEAFKKSASGELVYYINNNISKVEISLNIKLDEFKYYGEKFTKDAISINAFVGDDSVGLVSKNIHYNDNGQFKINASQNNILPFSSKVFPSTSEKNNYGKTNAIGTSASFKDLSGSISNGLTRSYIPYFKKLTYTLYYPEAMIYDENDPNCNITSYSANPDEIIVDTDNNKIEAIYNEYKSHYYGHGITYKVGNSVSFGIHNILENSSVTYEFYDGTTKTLSVNSKGSVEVVDPSTIKNALSISKYDSFEDSDNNTFIHGPSFVINNNDPDDKTNQVLEFIIDDNYQAIQAVFPKDINASISDIYYKTTKNNEWQKYYGAITDSWTINFTNKMANLDSDEYFIAVKALVNNYPSGYYSSKASPGSNVNATIFGNLKSGTSLANVKFYTYNVDEQSSLCYEDDSSDTNCSSWTRTSASVKYTKELTTATNTGFSTLKFDKSVITTGNNFSINGSLKIHAYPYGTRLYLNNAQIYLRQPKGLSLNLSSIKITDENKNVVPVTDDMITTHTNSYGDLIYVINTNKTVGRYFTKDLLVKYLDISISYKVNDDCEISFLSINDLVSWGNTKYNALSYTIKDKYDLNGNGKTDDELFASDESSLAIQPNKSVVISTNITKGEESSLPYNPLNPDTILSLYTDESFDYCVKIKNNTDGTVKKYEIYLPIPKTGYNYGERFQSNAFEWDMKLSEFPNLPSGYVIEYSTNKTKSGIIDLDSINFKSNISQDELDSVTMIKISSTKQLNAGESDGFNISLISGESKETGIEKLGKTNIWNPISILTTDSISGEFKGNLVATKLLIPKLSGTVFNDLNLNGIYDDKDTLNTDYFAELYKLDNNEYVKVEGAIININKDTGMFYIDDSKYLGKGTYAIKFILPDKYNVFNLDTVSMDGWITNIKVAGNPVNNLDVALVKYDLNFDVDNDILLVGEEAQISIKNISPEYFDTIKNADLSYSWSVNDKYKDNVLIDNTNDKITTIKGLKPVKNALLEATIYDRYGKSLTKSFNISVASDSSPKIIADDVSLYVNDKIEFEKYIKEVYDYKENKIDLIYDGDSNVLFESNIPNDNGKTTKQGTYQIKYTVTDSYGNEGYKVVKVFVKEKTIIDTVTDIVDTITTPSTYDNIFTYVLFAIGSFTTMILMLKDYLKKRTNC